VAHENSPFIYLTVQEARRLIGDLNRELNRTMERKPSPMTLIDVAKEKEQERLREAFREKVKRVKMEVAIERMEGDIREVLSTLNALTTRQTEDDAELAKTAGVGT
jgi:hypothetical protein